MQIGTGGIGEESFPGGGEDTFGLELLAQQTYFLIKQAIFQAEEFDFTHLATGGNELQADRSEKTDRQKHGHRPRPRTRGGRGDAGGA